MMTYWGLEVWLHTFLTLPLDGCFIPRERAPSTHWKGSWVGSRGSPDAVARRNSSIIATARKVTFQYLLIFHACPWRYKNLLLALVLEYFMAGFKTQNTGWKVLDKEHRNQGLFEKQLPDTVVTDYSDSSPVLFVS
jgi:hypothetical protein